MANATIYGFRPIEDEDYHAPREWVVAGSEAIAIGDSVYLNSAGRIALATSSTAAICGVAATPVAATAAAGDKIYVWDNPRQKFEAMVSTGALTDPYTHATAANCYDLTGATGAQYVNAAASTYDIWKCVGLAKDPVTGADSVVGTNQNKVWMVLHSKHQLGWGA